MARAYKQGFFKPINPKKYIGNPRAIVYRSSWELKAMSKFDTDDNVVAWASEELVVPYYDPVQKRNRRYFPDFLVKMKDGTIYMVEIKPAKECVPPKRRKKITQRFITESATYETNQAKWAAAKEFCAKKKWKFMVLNEYSLGIKQR